MRPGKRKGLSNLAVGAITLVLIVVILYFGFTKLNPFANPFELRAVVPSASGLRTSSLVRVAGVNVGKVTQVKALPDGKPGAEIKMELQDKALPIHQDATLKVRPRIFLEGNFFVDLTPGSPSAPTIKSGDVLAEQQASGPVQFDQLLSALPSSTRSDLQTLLDEYGTALQGGAKGFNEAVPYFKDAYKSTAQANQAALGIHPHDLSTYIAGQGIVAEALDRNPAALKSLVSDFDTTALAFARQQSALAAGVGELPRTLAVGSPALDALNASFPNLRRLTAALRPAVRSTGPAIVAATPWIRQLRGLVSNAELRGLTRDLTPGVPALTRLETASLKLFPQVRLASSCQNEVILPWTHLRVPDTHFPVSGEVGAEAPKILPGLAGESRDGDANGQWFRVLAGGGTEMIGIAPGLVGQALQALQGFQPAKPSGAPKLRPDVPCETQDVPNLTAVTAGAPPNQQPAVLHTAAARTRSAKAQASAVALARKLITSLGLKNVRVLNHTSTPAELQKILTAGRRLLGAKP